MKTLWILRHAHASRANPRLSDHARPLDERGVEEALQVGQLMRGEDAHPTLLLSSTAERARRTAQAVVAACGGELALHASLYNAPADSYLRLLCDLPDEVERAMVVGHNPGLEVLLFTLTRCDEVLTPAALAQVELPIEQWAELHSHTRGTLVRLYLPADQP